MHRRQPRPPDKSRRKRPMKTLILTTALALSLTAPAFAASQLEQSLGVPAGKYTISELAEMQGKRHLDQRNERVSQFGNHSRFSATVSTRGGHSARAQAIFDSIRA